MLIDEKPNDTSDVLFSEFHSEKMLSKKQLELEMQYLRLEMKLNEQIRKLIDSEIRALDRKSA